MDPATAGVLANLVLVLHVAVASFVVLGVPLVVAGNALHWAWVNGLAFRLLHAAAMAIVLAEAWLGVACPLTSMEMSLRLGAGADTYDGGFIAYWLGRLLYYDAPPWVFVVAYTAFGALVAATWWIFPPRRVADVAHGKTPFVRL